MNVNMDLKRIEELDMMFEVMLSKALQQGITVNFNVNLSSIKTDAKLCEDVKKKEIIKHIKSEEKKGESTTKDLPVHKVTFTRCPKCKVVQIVNPGYSKCYQCGEKVATDKRDCHVKCTCGKDIELSILGKNVEYVNCVHCKARHAIVLDEKTNTWVKKEDK